MAQLAAPDLDRSLSLSLLEQAEALYRVADLGRAEELYREFLKEHPNHPRALYRLGKIALRVGVPGFALAFITRASAVSPEDPSIKRALGEALHRCGKSAEAERHLLAALEQTPNDPKIYSILSTVLSDQGKLAEAFRVLQVAREVAPHDQQVYRCRAVLNITIGQPDQALADFLKVVELAPEDPHTGAGVLFTRHYLSDDDLDGYVAEARSWGRRHADPFTRTVEPHQNDRQVNRRLRIGYISPDFQEHPVGRILQRVLSAHDPSQVEVFCYANRRNVDPVAANIVKAAHHWRSVLHMSDASAAEVIRNDKIDILIDLSGHTAANRLLVLARKPAPVQAVWLGYFDTTGMAAIDYIFADPQVCPPESDRYYVEKVIRLPSSVFCYAPPSGCPAVSPLPSASRGRVTFGCFNNLAKIRPEVIELWSRILRERPEAELRLKYFGFEDETVRAYFADLFAEHGVDPSRIVFLGRSSLADHLAAYGDVDVALDPFPYSGGITTLDALWMGVPVVSLAGRRFVGRMSASILTAVGLPELVAESPDDYVAKALALADSRERLAALRSGLREQMASSPLCDGPGFARALEASYREMWRAWCDRKDGS